MKRPSKDLTNVTLVSEDEGCLLGCIENFFCSISISDTLFLLYFLILRQVYFLQFFDLKPPSFAKFTFCKMEFCYVDIGTKRADFQGRNIF